MKQIKKQMIRQFKINKFDCDMMGYYKQPGDDFEAHHLIIPSSCEGKLTRLNTAILYTTPHEYLHVIEKYDFDVFSAITSEIFDMNIKGYLDTENLYYIDDCLQYFEKEHSSTKTNRGRPIIKENYLHRHYFML